MDPLLGYAVHFTRGADPVSAAKARAAPTPDAPSHADFVQWLDDVDDTGFRASLSILWQGFIRPTSYPLGAAHEMAEFQVEHRAACFSETPLDSLGRLVSTRSLYGVGFDQRFLQAHRGGPVTYLGHGSAEAQQWNDEMRRRNVGAVDKEDPFWTAALFVDELDPAADTSWEREWRVPGGLHFAPDDVAFVFLPEELHENARTFFLEHSLANTGPAYLGRYLDARWNRSDIEKALSGAVPSTAPPPSATSSN
jgi:hypothetical protein